MLHNIAYPILVHDFPPVSPQMVSLLVIDKAVLRPVLFGSCCSGGHVQHPQSDLCQQRGVYAKYLPEVDG